MVVLVANFTDLAVQLNPLLASEGVELNFNGYVDTWQRYLRCNETLLDEMYELMKETLAWSEYFSEVQSWMEWRYLTEVNKEEYFGSYYHRIDVNHSQFKAVQQQYDEAVQLRRLLKLFLSFLETQRKAFERAHFQLRDMYLTQIEKTNATLWFEVNEN